jgi:hypothetical protein
MKPMRTAMCDKPGMETAGAFLSRMRNLRIDHEPDGWPEVQTRDIDRLCDLVANAIPALDLLQACLESGGVFNYQDGAWWLFDEHGEGICSGDTIREMLVNLVFTVC